MAKRSNSKNIPNVKSRYSPNTTDLAWRFAQGEDCGEALHKALLQQGCDEEAAHFGADSNTCCRPGRHCFVLCDILKKRAPAPIKAETITLPPDFSEDDKASMRQVCRDLEAAGVKRVELRYDGYGDSGTVEESSYYNAKDKVIAKEALPSYVFVNGGGSSMDELLEEFCTDTLCESQPGWEINEGSYGTLSIFVSERRAEINHYNRSVDSVCDEITFDE